MQPYVRDTLVEAFLFDWLGLLGRWLHLIAGIAWIGASFYFVWLDNQLRPPADGVRSEHEIAGELWAVHGGGFYHSQKYRIAPVKLPGTLHWFYWEAYTTWLSGFFLLCLIYYARAELYLIDPQVLALSKPAAIGIALTFLAGSWFIYDALCRSALGRNERKLGLTIATLLVAEAWALCQLFSGRGAFIQFGAALGTIMVANVFFVIIPGQRELVRAKLQGRVPDPHHGLRGKQRSVHNTYFTLPVLFTMISNHYPIAYGSAYNWLVLIGISIAGAAIRIWFVARHKAHERGGRSSPWPAVLGAVSLAAVALALAPARSSQVAASATTFSHIEPIFRQRCQPCHSIAPTQPGFTVAPAGVLLDTTEHILATLPRTQQELLARSMPLANLTGMTEQERSAVLAWIENGAPH
jgi:uncharacterized membrane protein